MSETPEEHINRAIPQWGMSEPPAVKQAREAQEREAIARNVESISRSMDAMLQQVYGVQVGDAARVQAEKERKEREARERRERAPQSRGISLEKSPETRERFTGKGVYDSEARRQAVARQQEAMGISRELRDIYRLGTLGQARPAWEAAQQQAKETQEKRLDAIGLERERQNREREGRGRDGMGRERS